MATGQRSSANDTPAYSCLSAGSAQCEMNTSLVSNTTDSGRIIELSVNRRCCILQCGRR